jgi:hypothetical protein
MSNVILKKLFFILLLTTCIGCATIFDGSKQSILINTYPAEAKIMVDGYQIGTTPAIVKIKRKSKSPIVLEADGYEQREIELTRKFNGTSVLNFINIYGWGLDMLTGSIHRFKETSIVQSLKPTKEKKLVHQVEILNTPFKPDKILFYSSADKLQQEDFKGVVDKKYKIFSAATCSNINCQYVLSDSTAIVRVMTYFIKDKSFFIAKRDQAYPVLQHEQQHYNITEIISRKIRQKILLHPFKRETFESELNSIVFSSFQELHQLQAQYDDEVYNNENNLFELNKQRKWNKKVESDLKELDGFKTIDCLVNF